jgi:hypothetical protein
MASAADAETDGDGEKKHHVKLTPEERGRLGQMISAGGEAVAHRIEHE